MALHGVDVSGYQPDWKPAANDSFVFVKATEGHTVVNKSAPDQLRAARAKGLQVGHYHFMWPGQPKTQAEWFASKADIKPGDLLVCDFENTKGGHPSAADAATFIAEVKRLKPNNKVGLYCNRYDLGNYKPTTGDFLWIATWGTSTGPTTTPAWTFWQYTDKPLDQNWASSKFATLDQLKAWAGNPITYPTPKTTDVYLSKLKLGQTDSDSVWQLENALNKLGSTLILDGDFGKSTLEEWARAIFKAAGVDVTIHNDL